MSATPDDVSDWLEEADGLVSTYWDGPPEKLKLAVSLFTRVINAMPGLVTPWINRGYARMQLKDYEKALLDFREALRRDHNSNAAYSNLGYCYEALGDVDSALDAYRNAVRCDPLDMEARQAVSELESRKATGSPPLSVEERKQVLNDVVTDSSRELAWLGPLMSVDEKIAHFLSCYQLSLPSEDEVANLRPHALAAYAARCASYTVGIARLLLGPVLSTEATTIIDDTLASAWRFASHSSSCDEFNIEHRSQMATIAKVAADRAYTAAQHNDWSEALRFGSAALSVWAVDFSARVGEREGGNRLACVAMIYSAAAYCQWESAHLIDVRTNDESRAKRRTQLANDVSVALSQDLKAARNWHESHGQIDIFGHMRLPVETGSVSENWRDVVVFASSTFRDMKDERDYIKNHVFPRLADALRPYRIRPVLDDLRWYIPSGVDAGKHQHELLVLRHCFREIDRCHPFFIALLGERYGWIPPRHQVQSAIGNTDIPIDGKSITALEIMYGLHKRGHMFVYLRESAAATGRQVSAGHPTADAATDRLRCDELRTALESDGSAQLRRYHRIEGTPDRDDNLPALGTQMLEDLFYAIRDHAREGPTEPYTLQPFTTSQDPASYCRAYFERNRAPWTERIVAKLCQRYVNSNSPAWMMSALSMLVRFDQDDFDRVEQEDDAASWMEKVESHALERIERLPIEEASLHEALLQELEQAVEPKSRLVPKLLQFVSTLFRTRKSPKSTRRFVPRILQLISSSKRGLLESDLVALCANCPDVQWSSQQFAELRFHVGSNVAQHDTGPWVFGSQGFKKAVDKRYGPLSPQLYARLGEHFASLPTTDPRCVDAIGYFRKGDAVGRAAALFGAYDGGHTGLDSGTGWLKQVGRSIADEIIAEERHQGIHNRAANWLCRMVEAPGQSGMTTFRLCDRVFRCVVPMLNEQVSVRTGYLILESCRTMLESLRERVPEVAPGHQMLIFGDAATDRRVAGMLSQFQDLGMDAVDNRTAEARVLDRQFVDVLLQDVRSTIETLASK